METRLPETISREEVLTQLNHLKAGLAERYAVKQIGVFGSVARGEPHTDSDIDVVVHMQPDLLQRACLKAELETVFGRKVDVVRYWDGMNAYLKGRIESEALYV